MRRHQDRKIGFFLLQLLLPSDFDRSSRKTCKNDVDDDHILKRAKKSLRRLWALARDQTRMGSGAAPLRHAAAFPRTAARCLNDLTCPSSSSSIFIINFQVFRPEPSKSDGTSSCSRKFPNFLSWWHRKWISPALILLGLKGHHEKHLENPAKVKPGAAST